MSVHQVMGYLVGGQAGVEAAPVWPRAVLWRKGVGARGQEPPMPPAQRDGRTAC